MGRHQFLEAAAQQLAHTCPAQARFLLWTLSNLEGNCLGRKQRTIAHGLVGMGGSQKALQKSKHSPADIHSIHHIYKVCDSIQKKNKIGKKQDNIDRVCSFCYQFLLPGNYRVRLMPKMKITPRIEKLLHRKRKNYRLSLKQAKFLKMYKESKNVLLITCKLCGKTARHNGNNKRTILNKTTPSNQSHSGPKRGTPFSSPRISTSGQSTPRSSSRTPQSAKAHFTQLKRLLSLEEDKQSDKKGLKNFLLSL